MNSQESLTDQLRALIKLGNDHGLYDAVDFLILRSQTGVEATREGNTLVPLKRLATLGAAIRVLGQVELADKAVSSVASAGFLPTALRVEVHETLDQWEQVKPKAGE